MKPTTALLALLPALVWTLPAPAQDSAAKPPAFKTSQIFLYQQDDVLRARLSGLEEFSKYITTVEEACNAHFLQSGKPETLYVVAAVKPGRTSRFWFISTSRTDLKELEPLRARLAAIPPFEVREGPVMVGMAGLIAGGDGRLLPEDDEHTPPIPQEWKDAAKNRKDSGTGPESLLSAAWPDSPADLAARKATAVQYVEQILEPLGGKIQRPKHWHCVENHGDGKFMWTISEEDQSGEKGYETGVRIQVFMKVKERTGKTPEEQLAGFIEEKKTGGGRVISVTDEKTQGLFTQTCLEMEEGGFHILYSFFWGTGGLDIAVVSIAGARKEKWDRYSAIFNRMSSFELIDMKRFEQKEQK